MYYITRDAQSIHPRRVLLDQGPDIAGPPRPHPRKLRGFSGAVPAVGLSDRYCCDEMQGYYEDIGLLPRPSDSQIIAMGGNPQEWVSPLNSQEKGR